MSEDDDSDIDDAIVAKVSDYLDGLLPAAERDEVAKKIETDAAWRDTHAEMVETRNHLSGLQKARAPASFTNEVTDTIHKRSAGRFFASSLRSTGTTSPPRMSSCSRTVFTGRPAWSMRNSWR